MKAPMSLSLRVEGLGKRHGKNWIFRNLNFDVEAGDSLALLGANGSGKSSLLRTLCAFDPISEGNIQWTTNEGDSPREHVPGLVSYCAPDQSLIPDLTVLEHIAFHFEFRQPCANTSAEDTLELALLQNKGQVRVRNLSSGMRQRLSLSLAFSTLSSAVFLDEPTSHLDENGRRWFQDLMSKTRDGRTLIVASNHNENEYPKGTRSIVLEP